MKERPILFSAPMVRAILAGTKTVTRRIVKPQPKHWSHYLQPMWGKSPPPKPVEFGEKWLWREVGPDYPDDDSDDRRCPYGVPGDQLWVRETHCRFSVGEGRERPVPECVAYRATCADDGRFDYVNTRGEVMGLKVTKWTPAIHMPRWASRIQLEVVETRAERLRDITDGDAKREGVEPLITTTKVYPSKRAADVEHRSYRGGFEKLWGAINGADSWKANPWVWRVEFKRVEERR